MVVFTKAIRVESRTEGDMIDLTSDARQAVRESKMRNGILTVFVSGSTAAITTTEFEQGLKKDIPAMLARISPKEIAYDHDNTWHDGNGRSHVKASLVGPSVVVPFADNSLLLGTWQQIVFLELDIRPRTRQIIMQVIGE
jgi:secondary thiamine-phosphate synthase enzyme